MELSKVAQWTPGQPTSLGNDQLSRLHSEAREVRSRVATLRSQIRSAEQLIDAAEGYDGTVREQLGRLAHIDAFKSQDDGRTVCPVCDSELGATVPKVSALRSAHATLSRELQGVTRGRPKLDGFLNQKREDLRVSTNRLEDIQRSIDSVVAEIDSSSQRLSRGTEQI